ncbi:MAG: adenylate cyclase [Candidatus Shapirobacteria bacterium]|jgi:CYTH domain-containing protein
MLEIEKTYLVEKIPNNLSEYKGHQIKQGYISSTPSPLRIRKNDNKFELTKKLPVKEGDFGIAEELNIPLTEDEFKKLWPLVEKYLEKTRYYIPLENNLIAELNIYKGDLEGLVFVEVEFKSEVEMELFEAPDWFGKDVTQDDFSANSFLAGKNFLEIKKYIEQ